MSIVLSALFFVILAFAMLVGLLQIWVADELIEVFTGAFLCLGATILFTLSMVG